MRSWQPCLVGHCLIAAIQELFCEALHVRPHTLCEAVRSGHAYKRYCRESDCVVPPESVDVQISCKCLVKARPSVVSAR